MEYQNVSRKKFLEIIRENTFFDTFADFVPHPLKDFGEIEYQVITGDIVDKDHLTFDASNVIINGNVQCKWLDARNHIKYGADSGGSLFIAGNVICDYFNGEYAKMIAIQGSLMVNKIINTAFAGSSLYVQGNLKAEYFNGLNIPAQVGGQTEMLYGEGQSFPLNDISKQENVHPIHSALESNEFLNLDTTGLSNRDKQILIQKLIDERNSNK